MLAVDSELMSFADDLHHGGAGGGSAHEVRLRAGDDGPGVGRAVVDMAVQCGERENEEYGEGR